MWKLLTGVIADQIYAHSDQEKLLPEEQKGFQEPIFLYSVQTKLRNKISLHINSFWTD